MSTALDFARRQAAREAVRIAAIRLASRGIPVAPLKGALVATRFLGPDVPRPLTDVDLLVPDERFEEARELLLHGGGTIAGHDRDDRTATLRVPWCAMSIDLHRRLFPKRLFREDPRLLLARATPDAELFGAPVLLLHPHDAIAHALGHHAVGRPLVSRERLARDLVAIGREVRDPALLHLDLRGMGLERAVVFAALDLEETPIPWLREVAARTRTGPVALLAARLALAIARAETREGQVGPATQAASAMTRHLLNDGFARGAISATIHASQRLRNRGAR